MCHNNNEKLKTANYETKRTTKSRKIRTLGKKRNLQYLEILEADTIKQAEIKEKITNEYLRRRRKILETTLYYKNLIKTINTWVLFVGYSRPFLKWTREDFD